VDLEAKQREAEELRTRLQQLESEIAEEQAKPLWRPTGYYTAYYATSGFLLGMVGAVVSLLVNVVGAPIAGKNPLELIRIYLTFPLGAKALQLTGEAGQIYALGDGVVLASGCCLYLATGMLLGVPFFVVLTRLTPKSSMFVRLIVASVLALGLWLFNFYGVLSWLQPLLFGGNWITDPQVLPVWVAAATHLVFGWTMVFLYPLGEYHPYLRPTEK
jgi:hypothetical protein